MRQNSSFNVYMGFGGTNFGFMNGAGVVQSYDYDAPISENGAHGYGADGLGEVKRQHHAKLFSVFSCQTSMSP